MNSNLKNISFSKTTLILMTLALIVATIFISENVHATDKSVEGNENHVQEPPEPQYNENGVMQPMPENGIVPLIDQRPDADVMLAIFNGVTGVGMTSDYCTATQSHINLQISNTGSSNITHWLQTRAPGGDWITHGTLGTETRPGNLYIYNENAIQGNDYRVMYQPRIPGITISGQITCY